MIRRSPTRIELKLEDLNDFDYIQKFEKKKNPAGTIISSADAQKLIRQERIGLGFRPIRSSSNLGTSPGSITSPSAIGTGGTNNALAAIPVTPVGVGVNEETPIDMNITNNTTNEGVNLIPEGANNSTMSFDDSL